LILAVKEELAEDPARLTLAVTVYQYARDLVLKEGGDPRVILAAALLLGTGTPESAAPRDSESKSVLRARRILERIGLDEPVIDRVCQVIDCCRTSRELDADEFRIVWDAATLANLSAEDSHGRPPMPRHAIEGGLKTKAGKEKARSLLQDIPRENRRE
jgi:hypothetical protein